MRLNADSYSPRSLQRSGIIQPERRIVRNHRHICLKFFRCAFKVVSCRPVFLKCSLEQIFLIRRIDDKVFARKGYQRSSTSAELRTMPLPSTGSDKVNVSEAASYPNTTVILPFHMSSSFGRKPLFYLKTDHYRKPS